MFTSFIRIIKAGFVGFWRSGWLSLATIFILVLMLFTLAGLGFMVKSADFLLSSLQGKVDVSAYFKLTTDESRMLRIRDQLALVEGVKDVEYVSRDEAIRRFKDRYKENEVIMQSLEELGENPLEASLNIRANEVADFNRISTFIERDEYKADIDKVNYSQNREAIAKLASITAAVRRGGITVVAILALIAVLVAFNTIRMAIYAMREEIGVMRLVGASNAFIRGPFYITSVLYGVISSAVSLGAWWWVLVRYSPSFDRLLPGLHLYSLYTSRIVLIGSALVVFSVLLCAISSVFAVRRYLKV